MNFLSNGRFPKVTIDVKCKTITNVKFPVQTRTITRFTLDDEILYQTVDTSPCREIHSTAFVPHTPFIFVTRIASSCEIFMICKQRGIGKVSNLSMRHDFQCLIAFQGKVVALNR